MKLHKVQELSECLKMKPFKTWLEVNIGNQLYQHHNVWMLPFKDAKNDPKEGWYINWFDNPGSISNLENVKIGDSVADYSLNMTPYWTVSHIDEKSGNIYLNPIEPNPYLNGIGAGGHQFGKHDYDVMSGDYEKSAIDRLLQKWQKGLALEPSDMNYLLLGAVPVHVGPNGSQGGWYTATDTYSNRGGKKGLDAKEIMMKDAKTLKNQFNLDVPLKALDGTLDPHYWNNFINKQSFRDDELEQTKLDGEDFADPEIMAKNILGHTQPYIKMRNADKLISLFNGYDKLEALRNKPHDEKIYNQTLNAYQSGEYKRNDLIPLLKDTMKKLFLVNGSKDHDQDPYWHVKEKFINLAKTMKWKELIDLFANAGDGTNRRYVFDFYSNNKDVPKMMEMIDKEQSAEALNAFLYYSHKVSPDEVVNWMKTNQQKLNKMTSTDGYHEQELKKTVEHLMRKRRT